MSIRIESPQDQTVFGQAEFNLLFENFLNKLSSDLIFLTLSFFVPVVFYSILKKQFRGSNKNLLFAISLVLFFSPYLRSSAVWVTNDNLALIMAEVLMVKVKQLFEGKGYSEDQTLLFIQHALQELDEDKPTIH